METKWYKDALYNGMTANAFKLGTVLTLGWFWVRVDGCRVLYRGGSMDSIDFENILAVVAGDAAEISPPEYVEHGSGVTYFYVVRCVNMCGDEEQTFGCAVMVVMDGGGELAACEPNDIFMMKAEQSAGARVRLAWSYFPIEQHVEPAFFRVYSDGGTGDIDYENALAAVEYRGRGYYSYESGTLDTGRYLFAVRAEDAAGMDDGSARRLEVTVDGGSPPVIEILGVEAI